MKFTKTLLTTALLGASVFSFQSTAWVETQFEQAVSAYNSGDYQRAFNLFKSYAEVGDVAAQYNLGLMYRTGQGVKQDYVKAMKWYRKAADQGYEVAQRNLGVMYYNGEGVKRDLSKAKEWFRKVCDNGEQKACNSLNKLH